MRYLSYPELKDSGVKWLGEIPKHWQAARVKFAVSKIGSGKTPKGGAEVYLNEGIIFLRSQNVYNDGLRLDDVVCISEEVDKEMADTRVQPKDVLLNITGASIGRTCIVPQRFPRANVNQHVCIIRPKIVASEFLSYFLKSDAVKDQISAAENGSSREGLNFEQVGNLLLVYPKGDEFEQQAIATFLDRKTAELDELIRLKERQIELLGAKRQALISHAVTRGLDPSVKLRPSGIEWLGEIPAHWEVKKLKHSFDFLDHLRIPLSSEERGRREKIYPYYGASGIIDAVDDYIFDEDLILIGEDGANLYSRSTPLAFIATGKYWVNNHAHILRPHNGSLVYWEASLNSISFDPFITGSAQPKLTAENLGGIHFANPPKSEQDQIAKFISNVNGQMAGTEATLFTQINQLRNYRQALISAAVTGKIDVRGVSV